MAYNPFQMQLSSSQQGATSGKRYDRNKMLESFYASQIPAMRETQRYQGLLSQRQSEQEAVSEQHKAEMALEERALRQREKARKSEEKYAKIGLGLQGVGLGLQAWDIFSGNQKKTTNRYPTFMPSDQYGSGGYNTSNEGWNISGGGGDGISVSYGVPF